MHISTIAADELMPGQVATWHELQDADPLLDSPHLRPEWVMNVAAVRPGVEVGLLWEGGQCVGFFPFQRRSRYTAEAVGGEQSDIQGIVLREGVACPADLLLRRCGLRAWHFDHLLASQAMFAPYHRRVELSPLIDLSAGFEAWREQRSAATSLISQARRKVRKLANEVGPVRFEWHTTASEVIATLVDWKQAQLKQQGFIDPLRKKWFQRLAERIVHQHSARFEGVLSVLYAGQFPVAIHLGMQSGPVLSSWIPAYSAEFGRFSPGLLLHLELARHAVERGVQRIDMGRGLNPLKSALASGSLDVAIGSVDLRWTGRVAASAWHGLREIVYATPLRGAPLRQYRRLRGWMAGEEPVVSERVADASIAMPDAPPPENETSPADPELQECR